MHPERATAWLFESAGPALSGRLFGEAPAGLRRRSLRVVKGRNVTEQHRQVTVNGCLLGCNADEPISPSSRLRDYNQPLGIMAEPPMLQLESNSERQTENVTAHQGDDRSRDQPRARAGRRWASLNHLPSPRGVNRLGAIGRHGIVNRHLPRCFRVTSSRYTVTRSDAVTCNAATGVQAVRFAKSVSVRNRTTACAC
jgi:hypothetical protein